MKKTAAAAMVVAASASALAFAAPAHAAGNPVKTCQMLEAEMPEIYEFIATKPGGCVSTVASVGLEALMQGAFPSRAAAVGNCKALEGGSPSDFYPYSFYGDFLTTSAGAEMFLVMNGFDAETAAALAASVSAAYNENIDAFTADNRAECVEVLRGLHGGELFGLLLPAPPA